MKKGFTLIELLAVIVILAIIALIATPIILGIINDAREKANERSVELYASAVRNAVAAYQLTGLNAPKSFSDLDIQYDGNVKCTVQELYEDGSFYLEGCKVNNGTKEYSYGDKQGNNVAKVCSLSDEDNNGKYSVGDIISCELSRSIEKFYVIENQDNDTTEGIAMLAMYNLNVGDNKYSNESTYGIQEKNLVGVSANGYGSIGFSTTQYWADDSGKLLSKYGTAYPTDIYDENSDIVKPVVDEYVNYLSEKLNVSGSLLNYKQATDLGCDASTITLVDCTTAPSWLYSSEYWLGFTTTSSGLRSIKIDGTGDIWGWPELVGVRPVITISKAQIQ